MGSAAGYGVREGLSRNDYHCAGGKGDSGPFDLLGDGGAGVVSGSADDDEVEVGVDSVHGVLMKDCYFVLAADKGGLSNG